MINLTNQSFKKNIFAHGIKLLQTGLHYNL